MEYFEKLMNIITIGGYQLWTIDRYLKQREDKFNEVKRNFDELKKMILSAKIKK